MCVLGSVQLWRTYEFRGVSGLLLLVALAAGVNILEEAGYTRDIYLISPIFIMLFGPATYLAAIFAVNRCWTRHDYAHLLPTIPFLFFTQHVQELIALGSVWRIAYAFLTVKMLLVYKHQLEQQRSDSEEFSLRWFVILLIAMTVFNLIDLVRLNLQPMISNTWNLFGQGMNNLVWLFASGIVTYQFAKLKGLPSRLDLIQIDSGPLPSIQKASVDQETEYYQSIFAEIDKQMQEHRYYLKPRLNLTELSDIMGFQIRDISRAINLQSQKSFNDYINGFRIEHVCEQLHRDNGQSLTSIALDSGFSSKASFNKVFKDKLGKTPSAYRAGLQS